MIRRKSVKPVDTPDSVHASCPACDRHSSGLGVAPPARCYLPAHSPEARSRCAYLVLLRAEIARFTQTELARLCCSDPQLMPCGFRWRAVSSCAVLCSPDVPPVLGFPNCTSDGLTGFTTSILRFGVALLSWPRLGTGMSEIPGAQMRRQHSPSKYNLPE